MLNFFKKLFGFKSKCVCPAETVAEILTPPAKEETTVSTFVEPAKPVIAKKVKALSTPIKEGTQRTNVKKPNPNAKKPPAPLAPKVKNKSKPKAKRK